MFYHERSPQGAVQGTETARRQGEEARIWISQERLDAELREAHLDVLYREARPPEPHEPDCGALLVTYGAAISR